MPTYYYKENGTSRKRSILTVLSFIFLAPIALVVSFNYLSETRVQTVFVNPVKQILGDFISPLNDIAGRELIAHGGDYGIYIKNLKTGEVYTYNPDTEFNSASLYKLWVMERAYERINADKLSPDSTLSADIDLLNKTLEIEIPTPTPTEPKEEKKKVLVSFKVHDAIERMITVSDNYAALLLVSKLGAKSISSFLKENNYYSSTFESPPTTSARDVGSFFEKLYNKGFINKKYSEDMMALLKKQELNDRIPKYLPLNTGVAHKTGELDGFKHDGGIVFSKKGDYIIVVLSKSGDTKVTAENIANFSKKVFEYETR